MVVEFEFGEDQQLIELTVQAAQCIAALRHFAELWLKHIVIGATKALCLLTFQKTFISNPPSPMNYTRDQLAMLGEHFRRSGAPGDRFGLNHWLKTRVDDDLRESIVAQLFPGPVTMRDYAQNQFNAGVTINAIRKWLAPVTAPVEREAILRDVARSQGMAA